MVKAIREASNATWIITSLIALHVIGGIVFSSLERDAELQRSKENRFFYEQMKELYEFEKCEDDWFKDMDFCKKQKEFSGMLKNFFERSGNEMNDHGRFSLVGSMFFVTTLVTTLGYANFHPITPVGQMFTVVFGLIGIPIMGYALSQIGRVVVESWMPMFKNLETKNKRIVALCCAMVFFITLGGIMYKVLEDWSYLEGCYFSALTLMSVGFGDYLPSHMVSQVLTVIFILLGLGVAASLIAILQIHVEIRGERFASTLKSLYGSISSQESDRSADKSGTGSS
jgi:hypothetical protein